MVTGNRGADHAAPASGSSPIGLIAGSGRFPVLFAQAARARGLRVVALGHVGDTDPALAAAVDRFHWVHLGQLGRSVKLLREFLSQQLTAAVRIADRFCGPRPSKKPTRR